MHDPLALYIHWPFCLSKCPYCDFNSHVRDRVPTARFARALRMELAWEAARLGNRPLGSIFFGGGTPSLMEPDDVGAIIADAARLFRPSPEIEITLEANPTSVERERLRAFRDAGVNRVSLGVQALDDDALAALGRTHSASEAVAALSAARAIFPRMSFDLIYARPNQTEAAWRHELRRALEIAADHLSLYQLTIETGTVFEGLHRRGALVLPDDETAAELYAATGDEAAKRGLFAYEVSNYAAPGAESRHNLAYWHYRDYAGIGPGAHGRVRVRGETLATRRHRAPEPWLALVERDGHGSAGGSVVAPTDQAREMILMGLRLTGGVREHALMARTGLSLDEVVDGGALQRFVAENWLVRDAALRATSEGRLRLDGILNRLLT